MLRVIFVVVVLQLSLVHSLTWTSFYGSGLPPKILTGSAVKSGTIFSLGGINQISPTLRLISGSLERWSTSSPYTVATGSNVLPNGTYAGCATYVASNNRIYFSGGRIETPNVTTSQIVSINAEGTGEYIVIYPPVTIGEYLSCTLDGGNCVHLFGGNPTATTHLIYCPTDSSWVTNSSLPIPFSQHGSLKAYDGRIYVFGGIGSDGLPQNTTYIFDPSTYQWTLGPSMLDRLAGFAYSATNDGSYFFVIGGFNSTFENVNTVYKFDVVQQIWTKDSTPYPEAIRYGSSQIDNNNIFVIDGQLANGSFVAARYQAPIPASPSPSVTPSHTPSPSVTPSISPSNSVTPSVSPSVTPSRSPSVTPTMSPTPSSSPSPSGSPSLTPSASVTPTPSRTATPTVSSTPSGSVSPTPSSTPSPSSTSTPSVTPTASSSSSIVPISSLAPSPDSGKGKKDSSVAMVAGAAGGGAVVCVAIIGAIFFVVMRKKSNAKKTQTDISPKGADPPADIEMQGTTYAPINLTPNTSFHQDSAGSINLSNGSTGSGPERHRANSSKIKALLNKQNDWILDFGELHLGKRIGVGAYGEVYRASWRGIDVAVKKMRMSDSNDNDSEEEENEIDIQQFFAEAELMKKLRPHSNITQLFGVCAHPMCIVTEYVPNGNLSSWLLNQTRDIDDKAKIRIARGIAAGMLHLHSEGVIHRDLAARNILLDSNLNPKVSDFGMSRVALEGQSNTTESNIGPIKWMAPEALLEQMYNKKTDVWSYGVVLYEILTRKLPYENQNLVQTANLVSLGKLKLVEEIVENESSYPAVLVKTLKACLRFDPNDRPDFAGLVKMMQPSDDDE